MRAHIQASLPTELLEESKYVHVDSSAGSRLVKNSVSVGQCALVGNYSFHYMRY